MLMEILRNFCTHRFGPWTEVLKKKIKKMQFAHFSSFVAKIPIESALICDCNRKMTTDGLTFSNILVSKRILLGITITTGTKKHQIKQQNQRFKKINFSIFWQKKNYRETLTQKEKNKNLIKWGSMSIYKK